MTRRDVSPARDSFSQQGLGHTPTTESVLMHSVKSSKEIAHAASNREIGHPDFRETGLTAGSSSRVSEHLERGADMHMDRASNMHAHVTFSSDVASSSTAHTRPLATSPRSQHSYGQSARTANIAYSLSLYSSNPGHNSQSGVTNINSNSNLSPPPLGASQRERHHTSQERHHTREVEHHTHQQLQASSHQDTLPISHPASALTPSFPQTPAHSRGPMRTPDRSSHSIAQTPSIQPPDFMQLSEPRVPSQRTEESVRVNSAKGSTKVLAAAKQWQVSSDVGVRTKSGAVQGVGLVHEDSRHERQYDMREHRRDERRDNGDDDDDGRRLLDARENRRGDRREDRRYDEYGDDGDRRLDRRESKRDDRRGDRRVSTMHAGATHGTSVQSLDTQRSSRSESVQSRFTNSDSDSSDGGGTDYDDARPTQIPAKHSLERPGRWGHS